MKILLGINTLTEVNQMSYLNHMCLVYRLGRQKEYRKFDFGICAPRRMAIDNMRNMAAKFAIDNNFDYLWFIDDDVLLGIDSLYHLLNLKSDIAAGITLIRGYPYEPMLFSFAEGRKSPYLSEYQEIWDKHKIVRRPKLDAVGFSCCLIKVSLLKKIEPPWFLTGPNFTEDVFFCQRAAIFKKRFTLAATGQVMTEHILGCETIGPNNRAARMLYDEKVNGNSKKAKPGPPAVPPTEMTNKINSSRGVLLGEIYAPAKA